MKLGPIFVFLGVAGVGTAIWLAMRGRTAAAGGQGVSLLTGSTAAGVGPEEPKEITTAAIVEASPDLVVAGKVGEEQRREEEKAGKFSTNWTLYKSGGMTLIDIGKLAEELGPGYVIEKRVEPATIFNKVEKKYYRIVYVGGA